jgi:hypothetical protein
MLLVNFEWQNPKITEFGTERYEFKMETCYRLGSRQVPG